MATLRELREQRAAAWAQAKEYLARSENGDDLTAEDESAWQRANADIDRLGELIDTRETTEHLDKRFEQIDETQARAGAAGTSSTSDGDAAQYRQAFDRWMRAGIAKLDPESRALMEANFRAQQVATGAAGGYTVPEGFWAKVTETLKAYGGVREVAELVTTSAGNPLPWPTNDDTGNVGEILDEGNAVSEQDMTFGQKTLGAYTASSKMIRVSDLLLQDTGVDIESYLARKLGERIGRIQNTRLTTGTGSSQPQGIVTGATTGETTAGATAITYLDILDLIHSVDPAYRNSGRCRFMMHDTIMKTIRAIKDDSGGSGLGRPLWEPSVQVGVPDTFLGYPITINQDMASAVTTTQKTALFGDFAAGYVVRVVSGGTMRRLEERYAEYLQTAFFGYERFDGLVQDASAYKLMVQA